MGLPDRFTEGHSAPFVTVSGSILSHKYTVNLKQLFFYYCEHDYFWFYPLEFFTFLYFCWNWLANRGQHGVKTTEHIESWSAYLSQQTGSCNHRLHNMPSQLTASKHRAVYVCRLAQIRAWHLYGPDTWHLCFSNHEHLALLTLTLQRKHLMSAGPPPPPTPQPIPSFGASAENHTQGRTL